MEECEVSSYSSELQLIFYTDECPLEIIPKLTSSEYWDLRIFTLLGLIIGQEMILIKLEEVDTIYIQIP